MIRTRKTIFTTFFALMTMTLSVFSGCNPAANKESSNSDSATLEPTTKSEDRLADDGSLVISGELGSIDWQSRICKEITITGDLVVVDAYDLLRRGEVKVARDRLYIPTNRFDPNDADPNGTSFEGGSNVAAVIEAQKFNNNATIILDDGSEEENVFPPALFPNLGRTHPTVRVGSVLQGVSGKLVKVKNKLMLVPSEPLQWTPAKRPERPDVGEADVTVASYNVLNYFTTIDDGANSARGADTESELKRQQAKLVSAIISLEADVIGLMELENNLDSENRLVAALNDEIGEEVFKGCGLPDGFRETPGGENAIRVGIIYRADRVTAVGGVSMISDDAFDVARTPIVQSFKSNTADNPFTVIVNHFKSKGGANGADDANKNKGDGQSAYNATRRAQSLAICKYIDKLKQDEDEPRVLVIGDLNAYGQEDPIDAMRAKGLVDLREHLAKENSSGDEEGHYSFIYYGQSGSMDHAMATDSLANDVTGIATWHINADEPRFVDYNEEHNPKTLYEANPFRSSDHDPVLIGIRN